MSEERSWLKRKFEFSRRSSMPWALNRLMLEGTGLPPIGSLWCEGVKTFIHIGVKPNFAANSR